MNNVAVLTPDKAFAPAHAIPKQSLIQAQFDFEGAPPLCDEQRLYKELIQQKMSSNSVTFGDLATKLGLSRQTLSKCITRTLNLPDDRRDKIFEILAIDHVRAKICVVFMRRVDVYDDLSVIMLAEAVKSFFCHIQTCRTGIHIEIKAPIIHEVMKRGVDMLLQHHDRVANIDYELLA
jgi:hypothetical protein